MKLNNLAPVFILGSLLLGTGCGGTTAGNPLTEDSSTSGTVTGALGGALSSSSSSGTHAYWTPPAQSSVYAKFQAEFGAIPEAFASLVCPTFKTVTSDCLEGASTLWLNYAACSFAGGLATYQGHEAFTISTGNAHCGVFPSPGPSGNLIRQYVNAPSSATPSSLKVTTSYGTDVTVDDATPELGNFDGDIIARVANGGYGSRVDFDSNGAVNSITLAHRVVTPSFNHSISGTATIVGSSSGKRTISGAIRVYHNGLRVIGSSTFQNLVHSDSCCLPISGTITTAFAAGTRTTPAPEGAALVGKSEILNLTGCGKGTLVTSDGKSTEVSLARCF